eukprot:gene5635-7781_t
MRCRTLALCAAAALAPSGAAAGGPQVILTIITDNLGFYDTQMSNPDAPTPFLSGRFPQMRFACHFVGKGHPEYQTEDHLPIRR